MKDFFRVMFAPDDGGASGIVGTNDETVIEPTIEEREEAVSIKENTIEAKAAFAKLSIPESMLEFVVDKDKSVQEAKLEKFQKAWQSALKTAVKGRVAGEPPAKTEASQKKFSDLTYQERVAIKRSNPAAYAALLK